MDEPRTKRAVAYFDGQNLYHAAKTAWGYTYPNYDPKALAKAVCDAQAWSLTEVRFYTGIPTARHDPRWHGFWTNKVRAMKVEGIYVYTRPLRYSGSVAQEKGIDVRAAIDIVSMARRDEFDVCLVFSQDQDLSEAARELRAIAQEKGRWIKISSAFPSDGAAQNRRGIDTTDWIRIDRPMYDASIDTRDFRGRGRT